MNSSDANEQPASSSGEQPAAPATDNSQPPLGLPALRRGATFLVRQASEHSRRARLWMSKTFEGAMCLQDCPLFTMQLIVSLVAMFVSVLMLLVTRETEVYLPVLTSIMGYWLPAPRRPAAQVPSEAHADEEIVSNDNHATSRPAAATSSSQARCTNGTTAAACAHVHAAADDREDRIEALRTRISQYEWELSLLETPPSGDWDASTHDRAPGDASS